MKKDKIKSLARKIKPFALPGIITFAVMVVILIFRGIWPFGSNRIDYFDNMQQVAPLYAHLWDWMHGKASLWFDWYTGLGTNVSMSISAFSMLSPFNLVLYLVPRNYILESISILTVIKMVFMAVAMYALLNKKYNKLQYCMKVTFSCMYAFCGYVILYGSCFTPWMDIVALFPVLIMAYDHMLETGKKLFYICMVALIFIINYYLSAMALIYIFLICGVRILLMQERSKWKDTAWNVGIGTVTGIGLSAFVLIPVFMQLSSSQRGGQGNSIVSQYISWLKSSIVTDGTMAAFQRWMMFYGLAFVLAVIVIGIIKYKEDKKETRYILAILVATVSPVIIEGANLMWHFGSYNGYTLRNGFLIAFTLICVAARYGERIFKDIELPKKYIIRQAVIAAVMCVVYAAAYNLIPSNNEVIAIIFFMAILIAMFIVYIRKFIEEKDEFNCKSVIALIAVEVFIGAYSLIGPPKFYSYEDYQIGDYVQYANEASDVLDIEESAVDRIVNPDISLNANYPLILRRGALSSFTAALQSDTQSYAKNWGYSKYFLWLLDSGGTVFTNSMLHTTEAVNQNALDERLYTLERESGSYKLYKTNYNLPFGFCVNNSIRKSRLNSGNWITYHNQFYTAMTGDREPLVSGLSVNTITEDTVKTMNVDVENKGALYMSIVDVNNRNGDANVSWLISSMHIYVNDEPVLIPTLGDIDNTAYFTDYNNNLVYLGIFENENVKIRVEYDDPWYLKVSEITLGCLDMDKMQKVCDEYADKQTEVTYTNNSLTVKIEADAYKNYAVIPVVYSDNWKVTLDGKEVKAEEVAGLFTGVSVHSGENTLVFTFEPKGKKEGALISLATLLILMFCLVINHFKKIDAPKWVKYCAIFIYIELFNIVVVAMFLLPALCTIPAFFYQIIMKFI